MESSDAVERVFFACCCDAAFSESLQKQFDELAARLNFALRPPPAGSHHVTLCFVPGLPSETISTIWKDIQLLPAVGPIPFTLGPVEPLVRHGECRLLLRRVQLKHQRVPALQRHIELAIRRVCAGVELRSSTHHHITIARISGSVSEAACRASLSSGAAPDPLSQTAAGVFQKLSLIRSVLTRTGPIYTALHERDL